MKFMNHHLVLALIALVSPPIAVHAQGTAFTYQGRLNEAGQTAAGIYDFRCQVYDASELGTLVSTTVTNSAVPVTNGLFVLNLDFGAAPFSGAERWLHIGVRTNGALNFINLSPRQRIAPTPYAVYAARAGDLKSGVSLTFSGTVNFAPPGGAPFAVGSANKVGNLNADLLDGLDSSAFVKRAGDTMTGNLSLATPAVLAFGSQTRQMLNLFDALYGIGVQANTTYFRSHNHFAWFKDGAHADNEFDPGAGGQTLMTLSAGGNLVRPGGSRASACMAIQVAAGIGVGVRGDAESSLWSRRVWPGGAAFSTGVRATPKAPNSVGVAGFANGDDDARRGVLRAGALRPGDGVRRRERRFGGHRRVWLARRPARGRTWHPEFTASQWRRAATASSAWRTTAAAPTVCGAGAPRVSRAHSTARSASLAILRTASPSSKSTRHRMATYARIQLQVASRPLWHISAGGTDNSLVFYNSANSIVSSISESGVLFTKVLTITGGADIAEPFHMSQRDLPKGAVVIIDEENPGKLKLSTEPYDRRVAGIISGAGGVNTGLSLSQHGVMEGDQHVALTGRVYVQADASNGPIKPGDLLTSSSKPGHAMKVSDYSQAQGATLGKAMSALKDGTGLVLVLVTLH
jgi:hypothetical protein